MKELEVYIVPEDLSKISEIFDKHNVVAGVTHDVHGFGRLKRKEIPSNTGCLLENLKNEFTS